ncbi:MAG: hypothetical protein A2Z57_04420 [Planctomycetes bacterium RIFCSPHIGHO2_12_39_6]|nr:MAG: hypothetical protein A2Z57_04420 [Planctomycetes bacterium RIFCSPHIGHO2_12_39_6]
MNENTYIYTLSDPRNNQVRYVGKTNNLRTRFINHLREDYKGRKPNWIKSLKNKGLLPIIEAVDFVPENDWKLGEKQKEG